MPDARLRGFAALWLPLLLVTAAIASAVDSAPPSLVPLLTLSYVDPLSGETVSCAGDCRRMEVPDGVSLEVRVGVRNDGGSLEGEGVAWDLWFDQRRHPFPGIDLDPCFDESVGRIDLPCWQALEDRVDWEGWSQIIADVVCVPEKGIVCDDVVVRVPMDSDFDGSRGRGIYSFAVWVDRFRVVAEDDEFDNFVGPLRVKVLPRGPAEADVAPEAGVTAPVPLVERPSVPQPYTVMTIPAHTEIAFTLSSPVSRGVLEFAPLYSGTVTVEVIQSGVYENMVVEVRKVSTGKVLVDTLGKGKLEFEGRISSLDLKDDRRLEVVVKSAHGTRGVRGTIRVTYPARASYRRTE